MLCPWAARFDNNLVCYQVRFVEGGIDIVDFISVFIKGVPHTDDDPEYVEVFGHNCGSQIMKVASRCDRISYL
jgi:hypothetical protein